MIGLALLLVYPPPSGFPHGPHAAADCVRCHTTVAQSVRPGDGSVPNTACADCHDDGRTWISRPEPPPALRFGHRPHAARGATCGDCHLGAGWPKKPTCMTCHDGTTANARCDTCHPSLPDGRMRTQWPRGQLVPESHTPGFQRTHGRSAAAAPETCRGCHTQRSCDTCHAGSVRPLEIHPADYILSHAPQARRNDPDCTRCHRLQTFCVGCHAQAGVTDHPGPLEFPGRGFHPKGWVDDATGGATRHGVEARRNLRACVGCHREATCVRCHAEGPASGLRANPHPPGFRRRCARALDANHRGCAKCHTDRATLERLCD